MLHRLTQPLVVLALLLAPASPLSAQTPTPDLTSPEEGGRTFRIARMKTVHDNTFTPDELKIETGGDTFKITPLSGFTDTDSQTGTSVTFTLNDDGKNPSVGVEIELQVVSASDGDQTFSLTFKKATMMGQQQTTQQKSVTFDYTLASAINQPTPSTLAPSTLSAAGAFACASAGAPAGATPPPDDATLGASGGCATHGINCPVPCGTQQLGCGNNFGVVDFGSNSFTGGAPGSGCSGACWLVGSKGGSKFSSGGFSSLGSSFLLSYSSVSGYFGTAPTGVPGNPFGNMYSPLHRFIDPIETGPNYTYFRGGGEVFHFLESSGSFEVDVPGTYEFTENGNGTYTVTLENDQREEYDTDGKLTGLVDANNQTWEFKYGTVGSYSAALTKVVDPKGDYTLTYDATPGLVTKVEYSFTGTTWELYYDSDDNMTKLVSSGCASCGGDVTRIFSYSSGQQDPELNGNLLSLKNAENVERQSYSYSNADRVTQGTIGVGTSEFSYDTGADRRTLIDPRGNRLVFYSDLSGRLTKVGRMASGQQTPSVGTDLVYDDCDKVTKTTFPDGLVIIEEFDAECRLTKETHEKGSQSISRSWVYDATLGKYTKHTDWRGEDWVYAYDSNGNVTKETQPEVTLGGPSARQAVITHAYDLRGNRTKTVDALGVEHHFLYSDQDLLTKQIDDAAGGGLQIAQIWRYDANGRLTKSEDPLSNATTYAYEGFRVTKVTSPTGSVTTLDFDVDGRLTRQVQAFGESVALTTDYAHDNSDRLTKETVDPGGLALVSEYYFDDNGNLTRTKNPDGNFGPTLVYDQLNRLSKHSYGNLDTTFEYDLASRVTKRTEGQQGSFISYTFQFDGLGRQTKATDPLSHYSVAEYDDAGNVTKQLTYQSGDTLLADSRNYLDEVGRVYKSEAVDGATVAATEMVHDVAGRVTKQEDPLDRAVTFKYDALSRLTRATDALSNNTDTLFDAAGRQTKVTDALGNATETYFDADGQVTKQVDQTGAATVFAYDALGRQTRHTDPLSNSWDSLFDKVGRLTKSADPVGGERTSEYDSIGRRTKVTVKVTATGSRSTTFAFSNIGRLTRTTDPLGNTTEMEYDLWGRVTKQTDAEGKITKFLFDASGQLTKSIAPGGGAGDGPVVVTEYDGIGRRTRVLNDAGTAVLRFHYDKFSRQTKLLHANDDSETYAYDLNGSRTKLTRPTGEEITYLYDARGLLTKSTLPGSVDQTFEYDASGRRTKADDPNTDLAWVLDVAGRVTKLTDGKLSKTIVYAYDAAGQRTKLDGPEASDTQHWSFDGVGQVTKITEDSSGRAEWLYNLAGQQTKMTLGSGSFSTREYDAAGRITNLVHKKSGGTVIQSFAYGLDKAGNRTKLTLDGGDWYAFDYDSQYQLTKETRKTSGGTLQYSNSFWYDNRGNRTKLDADDGSAMGQPVTTTYLYSLADQLTKESVSGTDWTYSYDANGALTRKSDATDNHDYLYDARSLITKYDGPGSTNDTTYAWDTEERRVKKDVNGTVTWMLYDDGIGEILAEYDGSATPALQASYVPTALDSNISMTRSGAVDYFHPDALQSTWNITDSSETVQNTYAYQAFGSQYGTPTENVTNTRRFTGAEWNTEDSSQTHGVRRHSSSLGRWTQRDAIFDDSENLYVYSINRPTYFADADGRRVGVRPAPGPVGVRPGVGTRPEPGTGARPGEPWPGRGIEPIYPTLPNPTYPIPPAPKPCMECEPESHWRCPGHVGPAGSPKIRPEPKRKHDWCTITIPSPRPGGKPIPFRPACLQDPLRRCLEILGEMTCKPPLVLHHVIPVALAPDLPGFNGNDPANLCCMPRDRHRCTTGYRGNPYNPFVRELLTRECGPPPWPADCAAHVRDQLKSLMHCCPGCTQSPRPWR